MAGGAPPPTPAPARSASFAYPSSVITDASGSFYFTAQNFVFKVDQAGVLTRVAGKSLVTGYSGDGGGAIHAQLYSPSGLALDNSGNLYFAEWGNSVVRKVSTDGTIATVAGTGAFGYSGDGDRAGKAQLNGPSALAIDGDGNLYIADFYNGVIRKVAVDGTITTVVGNGVRGYSGDGGPAKQAQLYGPEGVAVDAAGNLYIADYSSHRIRKVSADGTITTVAGSGASGYSGDGGQATSANLSLPSGVAVDISGNIYIADSGNNRIRKVTVDGTIATVAGGGLRNGTASDGGPATSAGLNDPLSVAVNASGNIYIADVYNNLVHRVGVNGIIMTVAGNGSGGYSGDGGPATRAQLSSPQSVALDAAGNIYTAEFWNNVVRKVDLNGRITTLAGNGTAGYSGDGGPAVNAQLRRPAAVATDRSGIVYIADSGNFVVRKVAKDGTITTVAGNGAFDYPGGGGDGGPAVKAALTTAVGVAVDLSGNFYIADDLHIRKVGTDGLIDTVAGNGTAGYSGDGGPATSAQIAATAITVDDTGNVYFADYYDSVVRKVATDGTITTVAGNGGYGYSGDGGPAMSASLRSPWSIALDPAGNLYIAELDNGVIRRVDTKGTISTIAGRQGSGGFPADGVSATNVFLFRPSGVGVDAARNLYVVDGGDNAVFLLQPTGPAPAIRSLVNAASNLAGPVAPGEVVVLYGSGMGPARIIQAQVWNDSYFAAELSGTSVSFDGTPSPIIYARDGQVAAVVPYGLSGSATHVTVTYFGKTSPALTVPLASTSSGLFTLDSSGRGQAAALNQGGILNGVDAPALIGTVISFYATGEGQTSPPGIDGWPISLPAPRPLLPVTISIGGKTAHIQFAGGATGKVAGVMQIDAEIPSGTQVGSAVPVLLQVGGIASQSGVTIAVR